MLGQKTTKSTHKGWRLDFVFEYQILITALRNSLIEISKVVATEEAREEKAQVMFDFLTSQEFG